MKEVVEETVPTYKRNTKKCSWVNKDVIKTRRAKYKAWKKMQTNLKSDPNIFGTNAGRHTEETRIKYVEKRNLANKSKRKAIKDYETKLSQNIKRDSKSFYNYMKSKQKRNTKIGPLKNNQGIMITDNEETTDIVEQVFWISIDARRHEKHPRTDVIICRKPGADDKYGRYYRRDSCEDAKISQRRQNSRSR